MNYVIWIAAAAALPFASGLVAFSAGTALGWPTLAVRCVTAAFGLTLAVAGSYISGRFVERQERNRIEHWRFLSRLVSLHVLILLGMGLGFFLTREHHEWLRYLASVASGLLTYGVVSSVWFAFPERHERGCKMLTEAEVDRAEAKAAREAKRNGDYLIACGKRGIPSSDACTHILYQGTTGSGKTLLQRILWQSALPYIGIRPDHRAVIFDAKTDMFPYLAGMPLSCPVVTMNPFDDRGHAWMMHRDITTVAQAQVLAEYMVPVNTRQTQQHWDETTRGIIEALLTTYIRSGVDWRFRDVVYPLRAGRDVLTHVLSQTPEGKDLIAKTFGNPEHAGNVDATLAAKARAFSVIAALWDWAERREGKRVSIRDWSERDYILLLGNSTTSRASMRTLNQMIFKCISDVLLEQPDSDDRRTYILLDELRQAGRLDITDLLIRGRSRGVCTIAGFQDESGVKYEYETLLAEEIISLFQTTVTTKTVSHTTAESTSRKFNDVELWETRRSYTGDSVTISEELVRKPAVLASEVIGIEKPTRERGLDALYQTSLGNYPDHIPGEYIAESLCPINGDPARGGMPHFIKRDDEAQHLLPWTDEDYVRLKLPVPATSDQQPAKKGRRTTGGGGYVEIVPDLEPHEEFLKRAANDGGFRRRTS